MTARWPFRAPSGANVVLDFTAFANLGGQTGRIVVDINLPKLDRKLPFERLQQFAVVVGLDPWSILKKPELISGRRLRVYLKPVDSQMSGAGRWYSDIDAFERLPEDEA